MSACAKTQSDPWDWNCGFVLGIIDQSYKLSYWHYRILSRLCSTERSAHINN